MIQAIVRKALEIGERGECPNCFSVLVRKEPDGTRSMTRNTISALIITPEGEIKLKCRNCGVIIKHPQISYETKSEGKKDAVNTQLAKS